MSQKDSCIGKRRYSFCDTSVKGLDKNDLGPERIRKKSFNDHNFICKNVLPKPLGSPLLQKRTLNIKSSKEMWNPRKPRKCFTTKEQPHTPHNTTQFIVDGLNIPDEDYKCGVGDDKFGYDFQHHAMAGSMMELMERKLFLNDCQKQKSQEIDSPILIEEEKPENKQDDEQDFDFLLPRFTKSASALDTIDHDCNLGGLPNYQGFLQGFDQQEPLQNIVRNLVAVIKKKDDQINLLKAVTHNNTNKD
jgi:hypothetical protein